MWRSCHHEHQGHTSFSKVPQTPEKLSLKAARRALRGLAPGSAHITVRRVDKMSRLVIIPTAPSGSERRRDRHTPQLTSMGHLLRVCRPHLRGEAAESALSPCGDGDGGVTADLPARPAGEQCPHDVLLLPRSPQTPQGASRSISPEMLERTPNAQGRGGHRRRSVEPEPIHMCLLGRLRWRWGPFPTQERKAPAGQLGASWAPQAHLLPHQPWGAHSPVQTGQGCRHAGAYVRGAASGRACGVRVMVYASVL